MADLSQQAAVNRLNRDFAAQQPNEKWLTDFTYFDTREGLLYLAGGLDVFSRQPVGRAVADYMREDLVDEALRLALSRRQAAAGLVYH